MLLAALCGVLEVSSIEGHLVSLTLKQRGQGPWHVGLEPPRPPCLGSLPTAALQLLMLSHACLNATAQPRQPDLVLLLVALIDPPLVCAQLQAQLCPTRAPIRPHHGGGRGRPSAHRQRPERGHPHQRRSGGL